MEGNRVTGVQMERLINDFGGDAPIHPVPSKYATAQQMERLIEAVEGAAIPAAVEDWLDDNAGEQITDWLDDHPEATTTVEDGAITEAKLHSDLAELIDGLDESVNGASSINYTVGKNIGSDGALTDDSDSCVSDFIPYTWTGYASFYCSAEGAAKYKYQIAFYDTSKNYMQKFQSPATAGGVKRNIDAGTQVTAQGTIGYVRFSFEPGFTGKVDDLGTTVYWTASSQQTDGLVDVVAAIKPVTEQTKALLGSGASVAKSSSLASGSSLSVSAAPWFIKKNVGVSAVMKFGSFTSVTIGKGYENYRGRWIKIDGTNITPYYHNEEETVTGTPVAHGLTISTYLQVSMFMAADGVCRISINSTGGTFSTTVDFAYEWNYAPFLFGEQAMTDVKLTYSCADLRCPLWLFGDSYMGIAVNRIGGQLKNAGYFRYLINAVAGAKCTDSGTPGKSSYADLERMLAFATPKYIVWTLGANGGDATNVSFLPTLVSLCEAKGIELILYLPPSVPDIDHSTLNAYIKSLNVRYIDGNDAVGATSSGVWYTGMLSTDNTHPTTLGAQALAMRFLADCPELMQYGYSTGSVESEISGDVT